MNGAAPTMMAIVTTGTGGTDKLQIRQVPVPVPGPEDVLLKVLAAGVNNTEINTRLGWYSSSVRGGTADAGEAGERADGGWNEATPFPLIQGTDCCGEIVAVGEAMDKQRLGERVIVRACMRANGFDHMETRWLGSDFDGAFAEFVLVPAGEAFRVDCEWSDAELASIPCAYGTAENMLHRAGVTKGMRVLVPGASGGVGSAVIQLAKRRGAEVIAITSPSKRDLVSGFGADRVLARDDDWVARLGVESIDIVVDNVGGASFGVMLALLRRGGRYVSSGAIAGPVVELDMRVMYLKDITLIGCTAWDEPIFPNLVSYIDEAQNAFTTKQHAGKIVLIPPR